MKVNNYLNSLTKNIKTWELVLFLAFFVFSWTLMSKTFQLDPEGNMQIATKAWSDFAATIPLIRSFSFGYNFPPEYPIFAGQPIRYHFVFFALVGLLERLGVPINLALNIPSAMGFTLLLCAIYYLGKVIFKSSAVGIISVFMFLFNGSASFLEFFKSHPVSTFTFNDILNSTTFSSFGPYDGKVVSAFWNLNIYTNQRHLAFAYATFIFLLIYLYKVNLGKKLINLKVVVALGVLIGLFPFIHYPIFGMMGILLGTNLLLFPTNRKQMFFIGLIALVIAIPQIIYMGQGTGNIKFFNPGYLVAPLNYLEFSRYWLLNLGVIAVLTPIGFLIANKAQRKIFIPFIFLFVIGNLFKFSQEIAANHKFFNMFIIGANLFTAYFFVRMWFFKIDVKNNRSTHFVGFINTFPKFFVPILFFFSIFSGILDIFPILNDKTVTVTDIPNNKLANYIKNNTSPDSVILNSSYLYHPASLAGRKIMMGWPYFPWSAGYDTDNRGKLMEQIFTSQDKYTTCSLLLDNKINYLTIQDTSNDKDFPTIDLGYFHRNFEVAFSDDTASLIDVSKNCIY